MLSVIASRFFGMAASLILSHRTCDFSVATRLPVLRRELTLEFVEHPVGLDVGDAGRVDQLAPTTWQSPVESPTTTA